MQHPHRQGDVQQVARTNRSHVLHHVPRLHRRHAAVPQPHPHLPLPLPPHPEVHHQGIRHHAGGRRPPRVRGVRGAVHQVWCLLGLEGWRRPALGKLLGQLQPHRGVRQQTLEGGRRHAKGPGDVRHVRRCGRPQGERARPRFLPPGQLRRPFPPQPLQGFRGRQVRIDLFDTSCHVPHRRRGEIIGKSGLISHTARRA